MNARSLNRPSDFDNLAPIHKSKTLQKRPFEVHKNCMNSNDRPAGPLAWTIQLEKRYEELPLKWRFSIGESPVGNDVAMHFSIKIFLNTFGLLGMYQYAIDEHQFDTTRVEFTYRLSPLYCMCTGCLLMDCLLDQEEIRILYSSAMHLQRKKWKLSTQLVDVQL